MPIPLVDTHAHLDMEQFAEDRREVIARARDSAVNMIITVGTDLESSKKAVKLTEDNPGIYAAVGFHPHSAQGINEDDVTSLTELTSHRRVVALGEMGLDYYRNYSPREAQLEVLDWQLALVAKLGLPVIIHCRQAEDDLLPMLDHWASRLPVSNGKTRGVIHSFDSDISTARHYLDIGFVIALGAYIGYPAYRYLYDAIRFIPGNRLVVETDSPYRPPQIYRGQRNEPAYVTFAVARLAEIRGETAETVARETTENACDLFRIQPTGKPE